MTTTPTSLPADFAAAVARVVADAECLTRMAADGVWSRVSLASAADLSVALLRAIGWHVGTEVPVGDLQQEADALRVRLDAATAVDDTTRAYVERLEAMVDESRLPSGTDLIADIERFLRDRGNEGAERG